MYIFNIELIKRKGVIYLLSKKIIGASALTIAMFSLTGCELMDKIKQPSPMFVEAQNESMKAYVNESMKEIESRVLEKTQNEIADAEARIVQLISNENEVLENAIQAEPEVSEEVVEKVEQSTTVLAVLPEENSFEKLDVLGVKSSIYAAILASQSQTVEALKPVLSDSLLKKEDLKSFIDIVFANIDNKTMVEKIIVKTLANNMATVEVYKEGQDVAQIWKLIKTNNQWLIDSIDVNPSPEPAAEQTTEVKEADAKK